MEQNSTTSLDLPPALAQLLGPMVSPVTQSAASQSFNPANGISSGMGQASPTFMPGYAVGGMVSGSGMPDMQGMGAGGTPSGQIGLQPQGAAQAPMDAKQVDMQIQEFIRKSPEQVAEIGRVVQMGVQSGEIDIQDINMMEQLAMTALQNPDMYQYVRQFAIQQGFAGEQDISTEYDQGLIITVLIAARSAKAAMGMQQGMQQGMQPSSDMPSFADGGMVDDTVGPGDYAAKGGKVEGPGTGTSDSIPIRVSTGEYVIPAHVVKMKGKEFFDSMLEKYKG